MPERPDLEYVVPILAKELDGAVIQAVRVDNPVVLRVLPRGDAAALLTGCAVRRVARRAHFVLFELDRPAAEAAAPWIAVAPMLAGRFTLGPASARVPADLAFTLVLDGGRELRYRDDVQMGKVYVLPAGALAAVPGLGTVGVDVLDRKAFTPAAFRALVRKRRDQVKVFLMDKSALDALGNAYADEVLFEARLHPKGMARSLSDEEVDRLHDAIVKVLRDARAEVRRRKPALDEKVRDFLKVRGRHGEPCPRCGATIRCAGVHGHDAFFCPECQPDVRGTAIVDFRDVTGNENGGGPKIPGRRRR